MKRRSKKFHFIGIGGVGMSGLAEILLDMGHQVSGSDREKSELTSYLEDKGAVIFEGHSADNVQPVDFLVYSSAIPKENPEMQKSAELGIPTIRRAEMLGQLFNRKFGIGIAGTHGKTTTTSMLGNVLMKANLDPTIIVGGKLQNLMTNARLGRSEYLVAEADEYDRSFLALFPRLAVITSLEADHLDIYADLQDIKDTFVQFANQVPFDGSVIVSADDERLTEIIPQINSTVLTYGTSENARLRAKDIRFEGQKTFCTVMQEQTELGELEIQVPGLHNIQNALAVVAVGLELEIPFQKIKHGLATFEGVGRRFELIGQVNDIMVIDDYAHHPTEVAATIQAAKAGWKKRVVAVFQPHLYSRTSDFYKEFAASLSQADLTLVTDIYPAREKPVPGVTGQMIADALSNKHFYVNDKTNLVSGLLEKIQPGDLVLFLGAGDIWKYSRELLKQLQEI